jgi:hypothetical protein
MTVDGMRDKDGVGPESTTTRTKIRPGVKEAWRTGTRKKTIEDGFDLAASRPGGGLTGSRKT